MRILLAQKLPFDHSYTGASKVARLLLEQLAARKHSCRVLALTAQPGDTSSTAKDETFTRNGVEVQTISDGLRLNARVIEQIKSFSPTWTLITEDPTYGLLNAALDAHPEGTVFLSQSSAVLPFGPHCFTPDATHTAALRRTAGLVVLSRYLQDYIQRWGNLDAWWAPLPVYGDGPYPYLGSFNNRYVTMINPSSIKGIAIFLELARRLPNVQFAGVCTWATTAADRLQMEQLPNVRMLDPDENIDSILAQTRVVLVPSLWGEAFGMIVVDAMVRGIPVLASNVGGLPESKLGIDYVLPVAPIEIYEDRRDDRLLKTPIVPPQDIRPWLAALTRLVCEREHYKDLSLASREAALEYVSRLTITSFEQYLERLSPALTSERQEATPELPESVKTLSRAKLELLAQLLKRKT